MPLLLACALLGVNGTVSRAVVRNRCAIEQVRGRAASCDTSEWLEFRLALLTGQLEHAREIAPTVMSRPSRAGEALLFREANRLSDVGRASDARRALDALLDRNSRDPLLCDSAGQAYDKAGSIAQAEEWYRHGIAAEGSARLAAGRYYLSVLYFREGRWPLVIDTLKVIGRGETTVPVRNTIGGDLGRLVDWPAAFLLLGQAYENTRRPDEAKSVYRRLLEIEGISGDWQVNRALVALAVLEGREGDLPESMPHFARAIDLTFRYRDAVRVQYQTDTWRQLLSILEMTSGERLLPIASRTVEAMPRSAGAALVQAASGVITCRDDVARDASRRAAAIAPESGSFLEQLRTARALAKCQA